ncbi:unnamed protein product, partial [Musa acuminata var. zebrina]
SINWNLREQTVISLREREKGIDLREGTRPRRLRRRPTQILRRFLLLLFLLHEKKIRGPHCSAKQGIINFKSRNKGKINSVELVYRTCLANVTLVTSVVFLSQVCALFSQCHH